MSVYEVDIKPLEAYTFGTEMGTKFEGVDSSGKESYIMTTNILPDQTTIIGTLRYIVLKQSGMLNSDFVYSDVDKDAIGKLIGDKSFIFQEEKQAFGKIKKVSPLFLNHGDQILIKAPFNNVGEKTYCSIEMGEQVETSYGKIVMPNTGEGGLNLKDGYGHGYINLSTREIVSEDDIFTKHLLSGNRTDVEASNIDGFYRREVVSMDKDYSFGVYVEAENNTFPCETIAFMGRKQTPFKFSFKIVDTPIDGVNKMVEESFKNDKDTWYLALSDVYIGNSDFFYNSFAIVEEKVVRNLHTDLSKSSYVSKRYKNERINLIKAGSVFFDKKPNVKDDTNCTNMGYNIIVKLGGNR